MAISKEVIKAILITDYFEGCEVSVRLSHPRAMAFKGKLGAFSTGKEVRKEH